MTPLARHLPRTASVERLSAIQHEQLEEYARLLGEMNRKINLVSRADAAEIARLHIPHALAISLQPFPADAVVADWGTGGGLPALPLAIVYPDVEFHAVDAAQKKILAVRTIARRLGLTNLHAWAGDAGVFPTPISHSVSRATAPLSRLWGWHSRAAKGAGLDPPGWSRGLIALKGGKLDAEIAELRQSVATSGCPAAELHIDTYPLPAMYDDPYFDTKLLVHVYTQISA